MDFYKDLSGYIKTHDTANANRLVMEELGRSLASDRENFVEILKNAGLLVKEDASTLELVSLFTDNVHKNKKLALGASYLVNHKYRTVGADGEEEISESGVKAAYKVMEDHFSAAGPIAVPTGFGSAIATALGKGAQLGNTLAQNSAQKKRGAQMSLDKSRDAHSQIINGILASRQAEADAKTKKQESDSKTLRASLYVGGALIAIIAGIILYKKLKK